MAKFQKQIGWLLFITIPFVILLLVHFVIPFEIALNSFPKIQSKYNVCEIQAKMRGFMSYTASSKLILTDIFIKYSKYAQTISAVIGNSLQYSTHISNKSCVSANLTSSTQISYIYDDPTLSQPIGCSKSISNQFLGRLDLAGGLCKSFIQPQFLKTILSFKMMAESNSELVAYQYPSQVPQAGFSNNGSIISNYEPLYKLIDQIKSNKQEYGSELFITSKSNLNDSTLSVCSSSIYKQLSLGVCIDLNLTLIQHQIQQSIPFIQVNNINRQIALLISQSDSINSPRLIFSNPQIRNDSINNHSLLANNSDFVSNPSLIDCQYRKRYESIYTTAISVSEYANQRIPIYLVAKYKIMSLPETVMNNLNDNLKTLSILVSIAGVVLSGITAFIIKQLLFNLDTECAILSDSCQYILEDDTQIEIPQYYGTKDIKEVYQKVRIINKIHRFSNYHYFEGHPAEKILKYTEALHCLKFLNYDVGNIYQNLGEEYLQLGQWMKSIEFLQLSIECVEQQIKRDFGEMDYVVYLKQMKQSLYGYKQLQLVLRRRTFKLIFLYLRYFQFSQLRSKSQLSLQQQQKMRNDCLLYLSLLKKSFFPQFSSYSQSIIALIFECKLASNLRQEIYCRTLIRKIQAYIEQYAQSYDMVGSKLKQKGSKHKFFYQKNKMTSYSRMHPELLSQLWGIFKAKILMSSITNPAQLNQIVDLYFEGTKSKFFNLKFGFVFAIDMRRILQDLGLRQSLQKFQSTHIFKQVAPLSSFLEQSIEAKQIRPATKDSKGLQRQFVYLIDCLKNSSRQSHHKSTKYFQQHSQHIFQKLIKPEDRISIVKFNSNQGFKIQCKLLLKQFNQSILKNQVLQSFDEIGAGKTSLIQFEEAINITINRIKRLQSQKVILMYMKDIKSYQTGVKNKRLIKKISKALDTSKQIIEQQMKMQCLGEIIVNGMQTQGLRNCKLFLICSKKDKLQECKQYFGLKDVNKRIWSITKNVNTNDNTVYIVDHNSKTDLQTILMPKYEILQDNNIFIL